MGGRMVDGTVPGRTGLCHKQIHPEMRGGVKDAVNSMKTDITFLKERAECQEAFEE